jgi:predicted alternative tryptophan synthase beta-subunit
MTQTKILLDESDIPTHWYNVVADMPNPPAPPLGPNGQPIGPEALTAIFPMSLIEQGVSAERWIAIPEPVSEALNMYRPSPLKDPNNQGSLGIAISEAVEEAASRPDTNYALGSVLNHVLLHQTIIGLETNK